MLWGDVDIRGELEPEPDLTEEELAEIEELKAWFEARRLEEKERA